MQLPICAYFSLFGFKSLSFSALSFSELFLTLFHDSFAGEDLAERFADSLAGEDLGECLLVGDSSLDLSGLDPALGSVLDTNGVTM